MTARNFTFIFYPESLEKETVIQTFKDLHIPFVISPLHDKDKMEDGNLKKPHYHVILEFKGKKNLNQIKQILLEKFDIKYCEVVKDKTMMERYLLHMDDIEKAQYSYDECFTYGVNILASLEYTREDKMNKIIDITDFIDENNITLFTALMRYARTEKKEWVLLIAKNSYFIKEYLKSLAYELKEREV